MASVTPTSAAIYARISRDSEEEGLGVERQIEDCAHRARRDGYDVVATFVDNDISASTKSRKARPEYERMMESARAGKFGVVIAYSNSRLTRRPREVEDIIEHHAAYGTRFVTVVSGDDDLSTADGRFVARVKGNADAAEAERTSERVVRKIKQRADSGLPHGKVAYGYRRVDGRDLLNDEQAAVVRDAARRVLAGDSLRSICKDLNEQGIPSPRGAAWEGSILRQVLLRERNVGNLTHRGKVIGKGQWPPLLDAETFDRVKATLRNPNRRTSRGVERVYLLSGVARCGRCGAVMRGTRERTYRGKTSPAQYVCSGCTRIRRKMAAVDEVVEAVLLTRLALPDGPDLLAGDPAAAAEARASADAIRARLANLADDYADDRITEDEWRRITAKLRPRLEAAEDAIRAAQPSILRDVVADDIERAWRSDALAVDTKAAIVDALMSVTIMPTGSGGVFDPRSVRIEWKGGD